ncbi:MAG: methyltransferase [Thermoanaerobaculia bacterium]
MPERQARRHPELAAHLAADGLDELFSERFMVAAEIFDDLVNAACWRILETTGRLPSEKGIPPPSLEESALPPRARPAFRYLHEKLLAAGFLVLRDGVLFRAVRPPEPVDSLAAELAAREPGAAVGAEIVRLLVDEAPGFLAGRATGEEILFSPARLPLWIRYFSNDNVLYAINNTLGAEVLSRAVPKEAAILEVGGGCGSGAEAALRRLGTGIARYRFTEIVPSFARRGERAARAAASVATVVEAARLDMTKPWLEQGVVPGSFDAIYSVNCFHVAPDLGFVLGEARAALKRGGVVVVSECIRPSIHGGPTYVEFVFDFLESFTNVKTDPLLRPTHGFLTPDAWRRSFVSAGFPIVEVVPDVDHLARHYPDFLVGAVVARAG